MCAKWGEESWKKKRRIASSNRVAGGPIEGRARGTYRGGSKSQQQHIDANEAESQGQPIEWADVYENLRDRMPDDIRIANTYRSLMNEQYPEGT